VHLRLTSVELNSGLPRAEPGADPDLYVMVCTHMRHGDCKFQIDIYGSRAEALEARHLNYVGQTWDDFTLIPVMREPALSVGSVVAVGITQVVQRYILEHI